MSRKFSRTVTCPGCLLSVQATAAGIMRSHRARRGRETEFRGECPTIAFQFLSPVETGSGADFALQFAEKFCDGAAKQQGVVPTDHRPVVRPYPTTSFISAPEGVDFYMVTWGAEPIDCDR
jgi:hypothetical protein